ncbi:MAG: hypothetical protein HQL68_12400, partial [Magnetococcales bacterium]|nr:hypothetical protein [Magnetococcales bacterium]
FVSPRKLEDDPVLIPADIWSGFVDWKSSSVEGNGLKIVAVRVVPFHWLEQAVTERSQDIKSNKNAGRPNSRSILIIKAYDALVAESAIDYSLKFTVLTDQIRLWVANNSPEHPDLYKELKYNTIYKVLKDVFQEDKKNKSLKN